MRDTGMIRSRGVSPRTSESAKLLLIGATVILPTMITGIRPLRLLIALLGLFSFFFATHSAHGAADYVWMEGERPITANVKWESAGSSHADWLSGGKWLTYSIDEAKVEKDMTEEGAVFSFPRGITR